MTPFRPYCECGGGRCSQGGERLPAEAMRVAGAGGEGQAPDGGDLYAILPHHFTERRMVLVSEHEGWMAVLLDG